MSVEGRDYWQFYPGPHDDESGDLGWVAATNREGTAVLVPIALECPPAERPLTSTQIAALEHLEALACFGPTELILEGNVICSTLHGDYIIGGPMLHGMRSCNLDGRFSLYGEAVTSLLGDDSVVETVVDHDFGLMRVQGHFDDAGALRCGRIPFGTSPGPPGHSDPTSIMQCRQLFVVSTVEPLP